MNKLSRRIIGAIPVLLGISFLIFLLMHIAPGDPVSPCFWATMPRLRISSGRATNGAWIDR